MVFGLACVRSQSVSPPGSSVYVASIKPAKADARGYSIRPLAGRVSAQNVTLKMLIGEAYHVYDFQISGGPKWIDADRFDVEAKVDGEVIPGKKQLQAMLQNLLEDRFALRVRHETKEMPVFALVGGKSGVKLQSPRNPDGEVMFRVSQRSRIIAENAPLEHLTEALTFLIGRPVLDQTALKGAFDYKLEWSPDEWPLRSSEAPPQTDGSLPSLDAALQQQLGLRLVSQRDRVDLIILEKAERPTAN